MVLALGVRDRGSNPVTILIIIPVLGLDSFGVWNLCFLILEPVSGLGRLLINDACWGVLVPISGLLSLGIWDLGDLDPVFGLEVLGVVNLLGRVDWRLKVLEERS